MVENMYKKNNDLKKSTNELFKKKPVLFMSVSTGWAVRNFFQTGIVDRLKEDFRVVVFSTSNIKKGLIKNGYAQDLEIIVLDKFDEPRSWRIFRQLKKKIYMESRGSSTEKIWERYVNRPIYQRLGGEAVKMFLKIVKAETFLRWIEDLDMKINKSDELSEVFTSRRPMLLFATHASSYFEELLFRSALEHRVRVVFMILSWDHLSSKIILNRRYHSIFAWNNLTKSEILQTYSLYKEGQIKVVGVPQYDIYEIKPDITYKEWCRIYGLNPDKRTILFSTMPQVRHDQQHIILENMLKTIADGKKLPKDLQILIKCHPFDNTDKYDQLLGKYPVSIHKTQLPIGASQENWFPSNRETIISRDCLFFCNININIFSTVTLEAAYFDKPIIHIAFDPFPVQNRIPCREYYNFDHFKNITEMKAAKMVYGYEDLYNAINDYLTHPDINRTERKELLEKYFNIQPGNASDNVVKELINLKNKTI